MYKRQIDDILDVTGDEAALGKPIGSDAEENKTTFVTLYGIENAREEAVKLTDKAMKILGRFDNNEFLIELTKYLDVYKRQLQGIRHSLTGC